MLFLFCFLKKSHVGPFPFYRRNQHFKQSLRYWVTVHRHVKRSGEKDKRETGHSGSSG